MKENGKFLIPVWLRVLSIPLLLALPMWLGLSGRGWSYFGIGAFAQLIGYVLILRSTRFLLFALGLISLAQIYTLTAFTIRQGSGIGDAFSTPLSAINSLSSTRLSKISIVLPCANEGEFAVKTVESFGKLTPSSLLHEVIVVDDGSNPPLASLFPADLVSKYNVRFVRHETVTGLINAKQSGGDAATGDVIGFFDCHVAPAPDWEVQVLDLLNAKRDRIIVPSITGVDMDTWSEERGGGGSAKCYLSWDSDFRWFNDEFNEVPIMSGGLLITTKQWWESSEGYDRSMIGWGGENIDQSLRAWLCGADIIHANESFVGHMWRVNEKPETKAKYKVPNGAATLNRFKAMTAWGGDWGEKIFSFGDFKQFLNVTNRPNLVAINSVQEKLKCQGFEHFLYHFRRIYRHGGYLPDKVFRIRQKEVSGDLPLCIARRPVDRLYGVLVAAPCSEEDKQQLWHPSNRAGKVCCSGIRQWNTVFCMHTENNGAQVRTAECSMNGLNIREQVRLMNNVIVTSTGSCLKIGAETGLPVALTDCTSEAYEVSFMKQDKDEFFYIIEKRTGRCFTITGESVSLLSCSSDDDQLFSTYPSEKVDTHFILKSKSGRCIDSSSDEKLIPYSCYEQHNPNQLFNFEADQATTYQTGKCFAVLKGDVETIMPSIDDSKEKVVAMAGCVSSGGIVKKGQNFVKKRLADTPDNTFMLSAEINGEDFCIFAVDADSVKVASCPTTSSNEFVFKFFSESKLENLAFSRRCIDANDHKTPILYPCYAEENSNQEWELNKGFIRNFRSETCIDMAPVSDKPIISVACSESQAKWITEGSFEPPETIFYKKAAQDHGWNPDQEF